MYIQKEKEERKPMQEENAVELKEKVGFNNVDLVNYDYSYYYGKKDPGTDQKVDGVAYPLYYRKFVLSETTN